MFLYSKTDNKEVLINTSSIIKAEYSDKNGNHLLVLTYSPGSEGTIQFNGEKAKTIWSILMQDIENID